MKKFIFHYRHAVGHKHQITIVVDERLPSLSTPVERAKKVVRSAVDNIFKPEYIDRMELVQVEEL